MNPDDMLKGQPRPTPEQAAWIMWHLDQHFSEGGTYRHLIYDRLGFGIEAYGTCVGPGMFLSNLLNVARKCESCTTKTGDCFL